MSPTDFIYWLQGFVELTDAGSISDKQWKIIKEHLSRVVDKETETSITNAPKEPIDWEEVLNKQGERKDKKDKVNPNDPFSPYVSPNTPWVLPKVTC